MIETQFESVATAANTPPHSIEAEQALLGSLLLNPNAFDAIADQVTPDDFYRQDHQQIYNAVVDLNSRSQPTDAVTVADWFESRGKLDQVAGGAYLTTLANSVATGSNAPAYANIVREKSVLRQLLDAGHDIAGSVLRPDGREAEDLLQDAEKEIFAIAQQGNRRQTYRAVSSMLGEVVERVDELSQKTGDITGIATGFADMDKITSGLQNSDLIIVAGRPAMGKTTFAMNIAEHAAIMEQVPVAVFSMEMSDMQLVFRLLSSLGSINQTNMRNGSLNDTEWRSFSAATQTLRSAPIYVDDSPDMSPGQLRARARRMQKDHGIGLIVIDYLQLMQVPGNKENRATEIAEISRSLKALAKELDVPVIALSQLNRALEQRPNKRPVMADLRESGSIEQDADIIMFIYRDEVYNEDTPAKGMAEVIIGKHRNGSTGTVKLGFKGEFLKFENATPWDDFPEA